MGIPKVWLSCFAKWLPLSALMEVVPFIGQEGLLGVLLVSLLFIIYHRWFLMQCKDFEEALRYLDKEICEKPPPENLVQMCSLALPGFKARFQELSSDGNQSRPRARSPPQDQLLERSIQTV